MTTIKIADNARMRMEPQNYILEWKVKTGDAPAGKKKMTQFRWILGGYFIDLASLANEYISEAPARREQGTNGCKTIKDIVDCLQEAEKRISKLIQGK